MTFQLGRLTHCTDLSPADWILPRLAEPFSGVTSVVPDGFAAYARIVHGQYRDDVSGDQQALRWRDVAASTGRTVHPLMQWHAITKGREGRPDWDGDEAEQGRLDRAQLFELCQLLRGHTSTPDRCFLALWNGFGGWVSGASMRVLTRKRSWWRPGRRRLPRRYSDDEFTTIRQPGQFLPDEVTGGPLLHHPLGRDYFLFAGPVEAADDLAMEVFASGYVDRQTPQLFWPHDRAWCVATEIDDDSTLVGGSHELIEEVVGSQEIEAFPVRPDDDLTASGDRVNDPGHDIPPHWRD